MLRMYENVISADLEYKMVFIGGPRQVGKTTITQHLLQKYPDKGTLLNWDSVRGRDAIINQKWPSDYQLIVFDELHKYPSWKQFIKGIYDTRPSTQNYVVTGSARLNVYKKGGDSLLGRYHYWRVHPLTLDELPDGVSLEDAYHRLLELGGFPEPFLRNDERAARRWRRERFDRILHEDIRDLSQVKELQVLRLLADELRRRVGGLISYTNLANDIQVSTHTVKNWICLLSDLYLLFSISPLTKNIPRSILKPTKVFFYDNADVLNGGGAKLENLVATHLLKRLHYLEDFEGYECSLHYIRDKDGREVDFVTVVNGEVQDLIEVKSSDDSISTALKYYADKLKPKRAVQLVANLKQRYDKGGILVMNPIEFFAKQN